MFEVLCGICLLSITHFLPQHGIPADQERSSVKSTVTEVFQKMKLYFKADIKEQNVKSSELGTGHPAIQYLDTVSFVLMCPKLFKIIINRDLLILCSCLGDAKVQTHTGSVHPWYLILCLLRLPLTVGNAALLSVIFLEDFVHDSEFIIKVYFIVIVLVFFKYYYY